MVIGMMAATTVLVGCTTSANGTPTPGTQQTPPESSHTEQSSSPPNSEDETYGAPRVAEPLDASPFFADPCTLLTPAQQADLGLTRRGEPDIDMNGPKCTLHSDEHSISVGFLTINKNGLSDTYRGRDQFEVFEETTVAGYPAVHAEPVDLRATGNCGVTVGISDTLTMLVLEQGQLDADGACARARQAAAASIATLKGGS